MFGPLHLSLIFNWALKISRQVNFNFYIGLITICTYKAGALKIGQKIGGLIKRRLYELYPNAGSVQVQPPMVHEGGNMYDAQTVHKRYNRDDERWSTLAKWERGGVWDYQWVPFGGKWTHKMHGCIKGEAVNLTFPFTDFIIYQLHNLIMRSHRSLWKLRGC